MRKDPRPGFKPRTFKETMSAAPWIHEMNGAVENSKFHATENGISTVCVKILFTKLVANYSILTKTGVSQCLVLPICQKGQEATCKLFICES